MTRETMREKVQGYYEHWSNLIAESVKRAQEDYKHGRDYGKVYLDDVYSAKDKILGMLDLAYNCNIISIPEYNRCYDEVLAYAHDAIDTIENIFNN